ncbi:MAG: hypothetical protein CL748_06970 [Chloroflexi bacterium]|nr:hypothetical protein [Chloroflexota bacterium]
MSLSNSLISLQQTDQQLIEKKQTFVTLQNEIQNQGGLIKLRDKCEKQKQQELEAKVEVARLQSEFNTLKSKVSEIEQRLYGGSITNVKELNAIEIEYSSMRRNLAQVEESIPSNEKIAAEANEKFTEYTKQLKENEQDWKLRLVKIHGEAKVIKDEYNNMLIERKKVQSGISKEYLDHYNRISKSNPGSAIVKVDRGVCQGCLVKLPMSELNKIRLSETPITGSCCSRLLIFSN